MSSPVVTIGPDENLEAAARLMIDRDIGSLAVVDPSGNVVGLLTETEFMAQDRAIPFSVLRLPKLFGEWLDASGMELVYEKARSILVSSVMQRSFPSATPQEPVSPVIAKMLDHGSHHVLVMESGKPAGIIARHDVLRMVAKGK